MISLKTSSGISLIEVLVALLVVSVGVAGMSSIQTTSLAVSLDNENRNSVLLTMQTLVDSMSTNNSDAALDMYIKSLDEYPNICAATPDPYCASNNNSGTASVTGDTCSAVELAEFDVWDALCHTNSTFANLPNINVDRALCDDADSSCETGDIIEIQFSWLDRVTSGDTRLIGNDRTITNSDSSTETISASQSIYRQVFIP